MNIYTSYFGNIKKIQAQYPEMCLVSIAGKTPTWFYDISKCYSYRPLAPKYDWWKEWHDKFADNLSSVESIAFYKSKYESTVLDKLNCFAIIHDLERIANGNDICLLCYEKPPSFCHRDLVSTWLNQHDFRCTELCHT